jgi:aspartate/methionine/tyrosine aminotransferase
MAVGMKPLSFYRNVISAAVGGSEDDLPGDAKRRVREIREEFPLGAYTDSVGSPYVRQMVANFLEKRDGAKTSPDEIIMSNGASEAASLLMNTVLQENDEVMIPIPQYPLYSANITLLGARRKEYFLNEEDDWSFDVDGAIPSERTRLFVAINPGNPTGSCLPESSILEILRKIERNAPNCIVVADEVYQDNIWNENRPFVSFRKVATEHNVNVPIVTLHSTSKGLIGECGLRGGFAHFHNVDEETMALVTKLRSISLCPNTIGQMMMGLLVTPPVQGDESYELFREEQGRVKDSMQRKSVKTQRFLNSLEGVSCTNINGAMYAFPRLELPTWFKDVASERGVQPDFLYCQELLDQTGIVTVPGSGFGQREGTSHLRTTILPEESEMDIFYPAWEEFHCNLLKMDSAADLGKVVVGG